jgi:hypothetical protein
VLRRWYRGLFRSSAGLVSRERSFGSIGRGGALENEPVVGGARGTAFSATCSTMKPPGPVMNSQRFHSITGVQDESRARSSRVTYPSRCQCDHVRGPFDVRQALCCQPPSWAARVHALGERRHT